MENSQSIAVLITCHNRKENTLLCLHSLFQVSLPKGYCIKVFLVDDGSTDGTSKAVNTSYPKVHITQGDGGLYWNKGMRLAWLSATKVRDYDFYLWLNDDTILDKNAIIELIGTYSEVLARDQEASVVSGACREGSNKEVFSYGGRSESGPVIPNGKLQACTYINGNAVLVPKIIYDKIGIHSSDYTHGMGDFDYGLRALGAGFYCFTTRSYIATCSSNKGVPAWCNPQTSLLKRLKLLYSPLGLNIKEYTVFRKKFWGWKWVVFTGKAFAKALSPSVYKRISNLK